MKSKGRDKDEVRLENPVPQLLMKYGVKVKGNRFVPFCHSCKEFSGKLDNGACYCFVCGKSFDCFSIVGHFEGLDSLADQVKFLGGEELPEDDPKRMALKAKAQKLKDAKVAEEAAKEALLKTTMEKIEKMHELRAFLRGNKPKNGDWPSKEWADAYALLRLLDYEVSYLLGDPTGGNMDCFPDVVLS